MTKTSDLEHLDDDKPTIQTYNSGEFANYLLEFEKNLFKELGTTKKDADAQQKLDVAEYKTSELCSYLNSISDRDERLAALTHLVFNKGIFFPYSDYKNQLNEVFAAIDLEDRILDFCQAIPSVSYSATNVSTLKNQINFLVKILNKEEQRKHLVQEVMKQTQNYLLSIADPVKRFEMLSDLIFLENIFFDGSYAAEILTLLQNSGLNDKKIAFFSELERKIETAIMFSLDEELGEFIAVGKALLTKFVEADTPQECYEKLTQVIIKGNLFYRPALIHLVAEVFLEKNLGPIRQNDFYERIVEDAGDDYDKLHTAIMFYRCFKESYKDQYFTPINPVEEIKFKMSARMAEDVKNHMHSNAQTFLRQEGENENNIGVSIRARNGDWPREKKEEQKELDESLCDREQKDPSKSPSNASAKTALAKSKSNCNIV